MGNINFLYINNNDNSLISIIATLSPSVILTLQYTFLLVFGLSNTNLGDLIQLVSMIIVGGIFIFAILKVLKGNMKSWMLVIYIFTLLFVFQMILFPQNREYIIDSIFPIFFMSLPIFLISYSIKNYDIFYTFMKKAGDLIFVLGLIIGFFLIADMIEINTYSMSLSYYLLLPTLIYLNEFLKSFSIKMGFLFLTSLFIILLFGSRGALVCILIFLILGFLINIKNYTYWNYSVLLFFLIPVFLILSKFQSIIEMIFGVFNYYGIFSRNLYLILNDITSDSGRDSLYHTILDKTFDSPFLGIGILGDRYYLNGDYTHNIFIEVLSNFGLIFGIIIFVIYIIILIKFIMNSNFLHKEIYLIWFCIGVLPLIFSSSYWIDLDFWIFNGLMLNFLLRRTKKDEI